MTQTLITVAPAGAELAAAPPSAFASKLDEVVAAAKECEAVGASLIRINLQPAPQPPEPARVRATIEALRSGTDLIVQCYAGEAPPDTVLDAGPDMMCCALGNAGADAVSWGRLLDLHTRARERGVVLGYEVCDPAQLAVLARLLDGYGRPVGGQVHVELVLGGPGGLAGTTQALVACVAPLRDLPEGTTFSATGIGASTLPVLLASLSVGGHLRVGMEDTMTYADGQPVRSDAQLVARAAAFARLAQRPPMTSGQARALLGMSA